VPQGICHHGGVIDGAGGAWYSRGVGRKEVMAAEGGGCHVRGLRGIFLLLHCFWHRMPVSDWSVQKLCAIIDYSHEWSLSA